MTREITLMQEVNSPNVVKLKTFTKTENTYYLSMELLNGGDLESYVKLRGGFLREKEAGLIIRQIVHGLVALKKKNVMHRDLKLANIMVQFSELRQDTCNDKNFDLKQYIKTFDFDNNHTTATFKITDLGFSRKLEED